MLGGRDCSCLTFSPLLEPSRLPRTDLFQRVSCRPSWTLQHWLVVDWRSGSGRAIKVDEWWLMVVSNSEFKFKFRLTTFISIRLNNFDFFYINLDRALKQLKVVAPLCRRHHEHLCVLSAAKLRCRERATLAAKLTICCQTTFSLSSHRAAWFRFCCQLRFKLAKMMYNTTCA